MVSSLDARSRLRLYRLVKQKYARQALAGRGGLSADGRWHTAGRRIVYLASSESLAVLELCLHLGPVRTFDPYVMLTVDLPHPLVSILNRRRLLKRWNAVPFVPATQRLGDRWLAGGMSVALQVPSVHSGSDFNILFNPTHADASHARIFERRRYEFNRRLF